MILLLELNVLLLVIIYQIVVVQTHGEVELLSSTKKIFLLRKYLQLILNSFEYSEWNIRLVGSMMFKLVIIYRPPYSSSHPVSIGAFFNELTEYLESVILCPHPVLIPGDFNVHVDNLRVTML